MQTKILCGFLIGLLLGASARAEVRVFIQDSNGVALVKYECTAGEVAQGFALDITVDQGQILGVSDFFRGPSTIGATGYGVFPASFRDNFNTGSGTNINWAASGYTPLADVADKPEGTLPGLNSSGVTLELGGLWDPGVPEAMPSASGTLCALQLSKAAKVSVAANAARGGIVSAFPNSGITPVFLGAVVGPAVLSAVLQNGLMTIVFQGGELQSAVSLAGPWLDTGDTNGNHVEALGPEKARFFRVRTP